MTASVATAAFSPLVGPAAQQAGLTPARSMTAISRDIDADRQKQWAEHEKQRLQRESADLPDAPSAPASRSRAEAIKKPTREARRSRER